MVVHCIDAMMISSGCVYERSNKPLIKGSRVETIEAARNEYKGTTKRILEENIYI